MAHDRRPIYRAPTYIAVPLLGPHQPRYIGLTLYWVRPLVLLLCPSLVIISSVPTGDSGGFTETQQAVRPVVC